MIFFTLLYSNDGNLILKFIFINIIFKIYYYLSSLNFSLKKYIILLFIKFTKKNDNIRPFLIYSHYSIFETLKLVHNKLL